MEEVKGTKAALRPAESCLLHITEISTIYSVGFSKTGYRLRCCFMIKMAKKGPATDFFLVDDHLSHNETSLLWNVRRRRVAAPRIRTIEAMEESKAKCRPHSKPKGSGMGRSAWLEIKISSSKEGSIDNWLRMVNILADGVANETFKTEGVPSQHTYLVT